MGFVALELDLRLVLETGLARVVGVQAQTFLAFGDIDYVTVLGALFGLGVALPGVQKLVLVEADFPILALAPYFGVLLADQHSFFFFNLPLLDLALDILLLALLFVELAAGLLAGIRLRFLHWLAQLQLRLRFLALSRYLRNHLPSGLRVVVRLALSYLLSTCLRSA